MHCVAHVMAEGHPQQFWLYKKKEKKNVKVMAGRSGQSSSGQKERDRCPKLEKWIFNPGQQHALMENKILFLKLVMGLIVTVQAVTKRKVRVGVGWWTKVAGTGSSGLLQWTKCRCSTKGSPNLPQIFHYRRNHSVSTECSKPDWKKCT